MKFASSSGILRPAHPQAPSGCPVRGDWLTGRMNAQWPLELGVFLGSTQVGYLWLCGCLLSLEFAVVIPHTNQRGLVCVMGGGFIRQKEGEAVAPNGKSFPVLALGCGTAEWQAGRGGSADVMCGLDGIAKSRASSVRQ